MTASQVGEDVTFVDVDASRVTTVHVKEFHSYPEFQSSSLWSDPIRVGDHVVVSVGAKNGGGTMLTYAFPVRFSRPGVLLGKDVYAAAAVGPDRIWLVGKTPREVDLRGRIIRTAPTLPGHLIREVATGLLTTQPSSSDALRERLLIYDPTTGRKVRQIGSDAGEDLLATSSRFVFWRAGEHGCDSCSIHMTDVKAGTDHVVALPPGAQTPLVDAAFSPDERSLAVVFDPGGDGVGSLVIIDTATARVRRVPASEGAQLNPVWSSSGSWVFFSRDGEHIAGYEVGTSQAYNLREQVVTGSILLAI
jgi:hypothetical protein